MRIYPKKQGLTLEDVIKKLDEIQSWGIQSIEIFAPYHSGSEYSGLDVIDYYSVDPIIGSMDASIVFRFCVLLLDTAIQIVTDYSIKLPLIE